MSQKSRKSEDVQKEESFKKDLDDILADMTSQENIKNTLDDLTNEIDLPEDSHRTPFLNYNLEKVKSEEKADIMIDEVCKFYLNDEIMQTGFVQEKMKSDKEQMANLMMQLSLAKHIIIKLCEDIDAGDLHPRKFEVLSALQKSNMDIVKHLSVVQTQTENNYKVIRQEYDNLYADKNDTKELDTVGGIGSKGLLKQIRTDMIIKGELGDIAKNEIINAEIIDD